MLFLLFLSLFDGVFKRSKFGNLNLTLFSTFFSALINGKSTYYGISDLKNKESNRITEMQKILKQIEEQPYFKREAFFPDGKAPLRSGTKLFSDDSGKNEIGVITSGSYSPSLERPISMGYLNHNKFNVDEPIFGEVRNKFFSVTLTKLPFVPTSFKRN